jgi:hypothetical protein
LAFYSDVFFKHLRVSEEFLSESADVIREKLQSAAAEFARERGSIYAINMCLHTAGSVILSNPGHLENALNTLRDRADLEAKDLTTVLTVIALRCLIEWDFQRANPERNKTMAGSSAPATALATHQDRLLRLLDGFDEINWIIGPRAMKSVGLEPGGAARLRPGWGE